MINKAEKNQLIKIQEAYYMKPILEVMKGYFDNYGVIESLNYVHDILKASQESVNQLLEKRKADGDIKDVAQARKAIVGLAFSNCILYVFLKCKEAGFVEENIFVSDKTSDPRFKSIITIQVGDETQKPDMDLIFYSTMPNNEILKIMVVSLKTSLRERAGQTYKWKLLLEIAASDNDVRQKYDIRYEPSHVPIVCFATVNFYNEINQPQHRGMFKFFDASFIGKPIQSDFISTLSSLIDFVNTKLV
jgi:type II restriction enzyme